MSFFAIPGIAFWLLGSFVVVSGLGNTVFGIGTWVLLSIAFLQLLVIVYNVSKNGLRFYDDWRYELGKHVHEALLHSGTADKTMVAVSKRIGEDADSLRGLSAYLAFTVTEQMLGKEAPQLRLETSSGVEYVLIVSAFAFENEYLMTVAVR